MQPVYFDSTVFVAIFMGERTGPAIKALLKELKRDKVKIYTSIITIQEVSVRPFKKGVMAADNFSKVSKLARIQGITKDIALTAAKFEAQIIDQTERAADKKLDNPRRKWDCFHIAAAMEIGCKTLYTIDEKMLKRGKQLGITSMRFSKPEPQTPDLFSNVPPPIQVN